MADIELMIKISEEIYASCKKECERKDTLVIDNYTHAIGTGIPLPKGHGRLIDADALSFNADYPEPLISKRDVDFAPIIIEADKTEGDE